MTTNNNTILTWFKTSFYLGLALTLLSGSFMIYEIIQNGNWFVESLLGQFGIGLLFIYFSGKPFVVDERIKILKLKALAYSFAFTTIIGTIANYLITYPDGMQENGISAYSFVTFCLISSFIWYFILKNKE